MSEYTPEELAYQAGSRRAWLGILGEALRNLGYEPGALDAERLALERSDAIAQLREICAEHGDNDWPDSLYLADIIEKHLARHLYNPEKDS
jgi:hypothetical protein